MTTKAEMAERAIKSSEAAIALMHDANKEVSRQCDAMLKAAKEFLASDVAKAVKALQTAVDEAERNGACPF